MDGYTTGAAEDMLDDNEPEFGSEFADSYGDNDDLDFLMEEWSYEWSLILLKQSKIGRGFPRKDSRMVLR